MVIQRITIPMSAQRLAGFHRPPDWRDQIARERVAEDRASIPGHDDRYVTSATHFYRRRRDCQTMLDHDRLAKAMPPVCSAVNLHERAPVGVRTFVEASVLTNQPQDRIAKCAGVDKGAIECYENLFFDVRGRLADSPFIIESVIRLAEVDADSEQFAPAVVKLLAYYAGPTAIDLLMIPRGDSWVTIREVACKFAKKARILLHLDTILSDLPADSRQRQEIPRAIEAFEQYPGQFGDERLPRTDSQSDQKAVTAQLRERERQITNVTRLVKVLKG